MTLLDTHSWIWWTSDPDRLSATARQHIVGADRLALAAISCWEFAMLVERRRVLIDRSPLRWIEDSLKQHHILLLPLSPSVAVRSTQLGRGFHGDPADRLIAATALSESAALVTQDTRLRAFDPIRTVW